MVLKPTVSDEVLLEIASRWSREPISEVEALAEGEDSRAVAFCCAEAGDVVLRVRRDGAGFENEIYARELLAPVGIVVPKVLGMGTAGDLAWCINERVEGRSLEELTADEAIAVGPPLVETWRAIASVRRPAASDSRGPFDNRPANTWAEFLDQQDVEVNDARDQLAQAVGTDLLSDAMQVFKQRPAVMDDNRLVHFDFGSNNVMVADGHITAVLDWDYPGWGDPLWDVANLHAWRAWLVCMDVHADCFDAHLAALPSYRERIRYYGAHIVLGAIRWELFIDGDPNVRTALREGLRRLLHATASD